MAPPTRRSQPGRGRVVPAALPRRRRARPERGAARWSRRPTGRTPAIVGPKLVDWDRPRGPARRRPRDRPLRRVAHRRSSRASSTRSSTTPSATSSTCPSARCSSAPTSSPRSAASTRTTFPGSEDLDLCWRARLAGARRARGARRACPPPVAEPPSGAASSRPDVRELARRRVRTLLTCYSFVVAALDRPVRARALDRRGDRLPVRPAAAPRRSPKSARGGGTSLAPRGRRRAPTQRAQAHAHVHDAELQRAPGRLDAHGSARSSSHHHADERMEIVRRSLRATRSRPVGEHAAPSRHVRVPRVPGLLVVLGSRELITKGVPGGGHARGVDRPCTRCSTRSRPRGATRASGRRRRRRPRSPAWPRSTAASVRHDRAWRRRWSWSARSSLGAPRCGPSRLARLGASVAARRMHRRARLRGRTPSAAQRDRERATRAAGALRARAVPRVVARPRARASAASPIRGNAHPRRCSGSACSPRSRRVLYPPAALFVVVAGARVPRRLDPVGP